MRNCLYISRLYVFSPRFFSLILSCTLSVCNPNRRDRGYTAVGLVTSPTKDSEIGFNEQYEREFNVTQVNTNFHYCTVCRMFLEVCLKKKKRKKKIK